jgi:hypothetical protein
MRLFSDWRNEPTSEEVTNMAENLRQRLDSGSYLKQALSGTPLAGYIKEEEQHLHANPAKETTENIEDLKKKVDAQIKAVEERILQEREIVEEEELQPLNESVSSDDVYKLYRDKEENFECNITVEGASLTSSQVRLIIDTNLMNLVFYGKLYKDGRCMVPLKKMIMFPEGTRGQIRLEVIVDDTVFSPWESDCIVEGAKKVTVDLKQKKNVSINFGETSKG